MEKQSVREGPLKIRRRHLPLPVALLIVGLCQLYDLHDIQFTGEVIAINENVETARYRHDDLYRIQLADGTLLTAENSKSLIRGKVATKSLKKKIQLHQTYTFHAYGYRTDFLNFRPNISAVEVNKESSMSP